MYLIVSILPICIVPQAGKVLVNPSLKILIFTYHDTSIKDFQKLIGEVKNNNITYITLDGEKLSLNYFNQILSHIHS